MPRTPHGYVNKESEEAISENTLALLAEFEREHPTNSCSVCASPHIELINELLKRGAGCTSLVDFLSKRLSFTIAESTVRRHKRAHLNA